MAGKKSMPSVRKPPTRRAQAEPDASIRDAFIAGENVTPIDVKASKRQDVKTSTPHTSSPPETESAPEPRRTTVYFEQDVFQKLRVYCALEDRKISETVNEALEAFLEQRDLPL